MPKIQQLSHHEAQKIAAGEVVERPANIIKELAENSIDAGATRISIYVEDAGKKLIRIVDNGYGMDNTDAHICFDRYATSKITHVNELESINTFGFRGEALASIAAVSTITLITKDENAIEGTQVIIEGNNIIATHPAACKTGTDISVHNLFFNVPARKKFLKTTATEWRAIQLLFNALSFAYPNIHFTLFSDGKQVHNCPTTHDIKTRALQIWEPVIQSHLLPISIDKDISICGVISDHQQYRYDRSSIYFFVNKRWIKNQHLGSALIKGYTNIIPQGRYPIAIINITVPTHEVDINIHPRKEEVKFLHPRIIEQLLQQAVKSALEANISQHLKKTEPSFQSTPSYMQPSPIFMPSPFFPAHINPTPPFSVEPHFRFSSTGTPILTPLPVSFSGDPDRRLGNKDWGINIGDPNCKIEDQQLHTPENIDYRLIGQYKATYILIEKDDGLFLVDQHAAHERILYELFSERLSDVATIQLLFPPIMTLSSQDIDLIMPHIDIFTQNGIIIEQCAHNQLIVQSLPVHLKEQSINDLIQSTIGWVIESKSLDMHEFKRTVNNKLQAQMACKAAVKAGDMLSNEKMKQLLDDLEKTTNRFSCPHGRPTGWLISINDIEKKFKRRL